MQKCALGAHFCTQNALDPVALRYGAGLLAYDADLARVAEVVGITIDDATRG